MHVQNLLLNPGLKAADGAHGDDDGRGDAQCNQGELPVGGKGHRKGGYKGCHALECKSELLRDAALDEAAVAGGLRGDGAARADVKVGDFLAEGGAEIGRADVANDAVG